MSTKKEAIEVSCTHCNTRFRLWVPADIASDWEKGAYFSCVNCGMRYQVKGGKGGFKVSAARQAEPEPVAAPVQARKPAPAAAARAPEPAAPAPPPQASSVQEAPEQAAEEENVLLIEDDKLSRQMVEQAMQDTGIRILMAKNATVALRLLKSERIDLIVTDLYLKNPDDPESQLDGEDLLKRVADSGVQLPAIITTGKDIIDDIVLDPKWFDLRVKGFIQKGNPFWTEELKLKIKEVLYKDW